MERAGAIANRVLCQLGGERMSGERGAPDAAEIVEIIRGNDKTFLGDGFAQEAAANEIIERYAALLDEVRTVLERQRQGWDNAMELGLLPRQHFNAARELSRQASAIIFRLSGGEASNG